MPLMAAYRRAPTTLIPKLAVADKQTPGVAFALRLVAQVQVPRYLMAAL